MQNAYKHYLVVLVEVDEDGEVDSVSSDTFENISFCDFDRIEIDNDNDNGVFYIIRGLEERE